MAGKIFYTFDEAKTELGSTAVELRSFVEKGLIRQVVFKNTILFAGDEVAFLQRELGRQSAGMQAAKPKTSPAPRCPTCYQVIRDNAGFCFQCGEPLKEPERPGNDAPREMRREGHSKPVTTRPEQPEIAATQPKTAPSDADTRASDVAKTSTAKGTVVAILRWIAVLPAAVVGGTLLSVIVRLLGGISTPDWDICTMFWVRVVSDGLSGWAFVICGALTAPTARRPVGYVLFGVLCPVAVVAGIVLGLAHDWSGLFDLACRAIGSVVAIYQMVNKPQMFGITED